MPTLIEQKVPYKRDIVIPLARVSPGEDVVFPFVSLLLERMRLLAKCAPDDLQSDLFIVGEDQVERREDGLVVIRNSALIPVSSLRPGQHMVFRLKRKPESPVSDIKVSHVLQPHPLV